MNATEVTARLVAALEAYEAATTGKDECAAIGRLMAEANPSAIRTLLDTLAAAQAENEKLREAAEEICSHIYGSLPTTGYLRDNDKSRAALHKLRASLSKGADSSQAKEHQ